MVFSGSEEKGEWEAVVEWVLSLSFKSWKSSGHLLYNVNTVNITELYT